MIESPVKVSEDEFYEKLGKSGRKSSELKEYYTKNYLNRFYKVSLTGGHIKHLIVCSHENIREPFEKYYGIPTDAYDKIRTLEVLSLLLKGREEGFFKYKWFEPVKKVRDKFDDVAFCKPFFIRDLLENEPKFGSFYLEDGAHRLFGRALRDGLDFKIEAYLATKTSHISLL